MDAGFLLPESMRRKLLSTALKAALKRPVLRSYKLADASQACNASRLPVPADVRPDLGMRRAAGYSLVLAGDREEAYYRNALCEQLGGEIEVRLSTFSIADVVTSDVVFEVEPIDRWRDGARQAITYGAQCRQRPALALYGTATASKLLAIYRSLQKVGVALWWYAPPWRCIEPES